MFGYVTIYKPELKVKDYYKYKAYYCGLCRTLKENFGFRGQMTLTYDMTFVTILLTSLYEHKMKNCKHHCVVRPVKKMDMLQNDITEYTAEMNVILSYYHFIDDWEDEKSMAGLAGSKLLGKSVKGIIAKYPDKCKTIQRCLKKLQDYEKKQITDIDAVAGTFGELMGELLVYQKDQWEERLRRMGFFLGKFIYIMDAYEDVQKDIEKGNYNPLIPLQGKENYEAVCEQMLNMMMGECSREFELLPCLWDEDILKNILYVGVWTKYDKIQKEMKEGKEQKDGK